MITFYAMQDCPHCQSAMNLLEEEISNNKVVVRPHTQAPPEARGFPYFVSGDNVFVGVPSSKTQLFQRLGLYQILETYCKKCSPNWVSPPVCATPPTWSNGCIAPQIKNWSKAGVF